MGKAPDRLDVLRRIAELEAKGVSLPFACDAFGVSEQTVRGWRLAYASGGILNLDEGKSTGRPAIAECLSEEAVAQIRYLFMKTENSEAATFEIFRNDKLCPEELGTYLDGMKSYHNLPLSLRRLCYVQPEVIMLHKGPRALEYGGFRAMKDLTEVMPDGTRRDVVPGDWWEFDDMSVNLPFWYECICPVCGANPNIDGEYIKPGPRCSKLAHKYGVEVGRQSLWAVDRASAKWLGFELIGRPRDAYRAQDILRFMRKLFTTYGLPRRGIRLEMGVWNSTKVKGYKLKGKNIDPDVLEALEEYDTPVMESAEKDIVIGGLAKLGIEVRYGHTSFCKATVEGGFNYFQKIHTVSSSR